MAIATRRITAAVGLTMFIDATLYLAVVPLLPYYTDRFDLSKFEAAIVLAAYPIAVPPVAIITGVLTPRLGGRRIALGGAITMTAATVMFAFAPSAIVLALARFAQGAASGVTWSAAMAWLTVNTPSARRGAETGIVMGLLSFGAVVGPVVGAFGDASSPELAFLLVAVVSAVSVLLTVLAPAGVDVPPEQGVIPSFRRAFSHPLVKVAIILTLIDPIVVGAVDLLTPLDLDERGVETVVFAGALTFGALLGALSGPWIGRLADRIGALEVGAACAVAMAVAPVVLAFDPPVAVVLGVLVMLGPAFTGVATVMYPLASDGADDVGVSHGLVNALIGVGWAVGFALSPLVAGAVAEAHGDAAAYVVAALATVPLLVALAVLRARHRQAASAVG